MPHTWAQDLALLPTKRLVPLVGSILSQMRVRLTTASHIRPEVEISEGLESMERGAHLLLRRMVAGAWSVGILAWE